MEDFTNFANINNIKTLPELLKNQLDEDTIKKLPCNGLQSYVELHNHYNKVKDEVYKKLFDLGIKNTSEIMNLLEKSEISCEDYYDDDSELLEKINQNVIETQIDYTKLLVYFMVFCMFISFVYFFERKRCICPIPK